MATVVHVLITREGSVVAFDCFGKRLPEVEGPRAEVRERLMLALGDRCTIQRETEAGVYQEASRWNI